MTWRGQRVRNARRGEHWEGHGETVFLEILRRKDPIGDPVLEVLPRNGVDFVVKEGAEARQLIQVTYASEGGEVERREMRTMTKSEGLGCDELLTMTWDYEGEVMRNCRK